MQTISEAAAYTLQFINQTQRSVFLTGKAGTGKTTLLKKSLLLHIKYCCRGAYGNSGIKRRRCYHSFYVSVAFGGFLPLMLIHNFDKSLSQGYYCVGILKRSQKNVIRNMDC
jgi:hypothetical protein